jgi:hypothetical protein
MREYTISYSRANKRSTKVKADALFVMSNVLIFVFGIVSGEIVNPAKILDIVAVLPINADMRVTSVKVKP